MDTRDYFKPLQPVRVQIRLPHPAALTCRHYQGQVTVDQTHLLAKFGSRVRIERIGYLACAQFRPRLVPSDTAAILDLANLYEAKRYPTPRVLRPPLARKTANVIAFPVRTTPRHRAVKEAA